MSELTTVPLTLEQMLHYGVNCDHHFGDDGTEEKCTKCPMDRQMAHRYGRALHKRMSRLRVELNLGDVAQ